MHAVSFSQRQETLIQLCTISHSDRVVLQVSVVHRLFMCSFHSNPHSVSSLLVQQLLHQFKRAFLATPSSDQAVMSSRHHPPGQDQVSLREFLQEEMTVYLLLSIQTISKQVSVRSKHLLMCIQCYTVIV